MELIFLGSGSAFCLQNHQSNVIVNHNGKNLLIDCGGDIRFSLMTKHLTFNDIDAVYISHLHADHIGGLEGLAFSTYFNPACKKPKMFIETSLSKELWDTSLRGGLEGIEGKDMELDDYFEVERVEKNDYFMWEDIAFEIVQTVHVSAKYKILDSFGLLFNDPDSGQRIYFTTDTQFAPETAMKSYYKESDVIFHDCETAPFKSGVHSHYDDLKTLDPEVKRKILLYHYQDNVVENWDFWADKAREDGFRGIVSEGSQYAFAPEREATNGKN